MVVMTNPGRFEFKNTLGWEDFKSGKGSAYTFEASDYPDLSMQNVIEVVRRAYELSGKGKPDGTLRVYNLSNVRHAAGHEAEIYHNKAKIALTSANISLLEDPITHNREEFLNECNKAGFVIMGFVNGAFNQKMRQILSWSEQVSSLVYAMDKNGHYSHPRRWRTDLSLKNQVISSLQSVL